VSTILRNDVGRILTLPLLLDADTEDTWPKDVVGVTKAEEREADEDMSMAAITAFVVVLILPKIMVVNVVLFVFSMS